MALIILPINGYFFVLLSMYLTATSFIYLLQNKKGKMNKENFFILFCSFLTFVLSTFYLVFEFLRDGKEYSINSKFLCVLIPLVYKTCIAVSQVFSSLIFVYRYELINQRKLLAAPKTSKIFPAVFILLSILMLIGHVIYETIAQSTSNLDKCNYEELFINKKDFYNYLTGVCFVLKTILQTVILVEIIKPICKHYLKSTVSTSLKGSLRNTLCRVVCCAAILTVGDIGVVVAYFVTADNNIIPGPILYIVFLFVEVLSLVCSYKDCGKRLFPFKTFFKTKLTEKSSQSMNSEIDENAPKSQLSSTIDSSIQLSDESQVHCATMCSLHILNESKSNSSNDSSAEYNTKF